MKKTPDQDGPRRSITFDLEDFSDNITGGTTDTTVLTKRAFAWSEGFNSLSHCVPERVAVAHGGAFVALNLSENRRLVVICVSILQGWIRLSRPSEFAGPLQTVLFDIPERAKCWLENMI
jgi:hypothetical protein